MVADAVYVYRHSGSAVDGSSATALQDGKLESKKEDPWRMAADDARSSSARNGMREFEYLGNTCHAQEMEGKLCFR